MSDLTEATIQVVYLETLSRLPSRNITAKLQGAGDATTNTELVLVKSYWGNTFENLFTGLVGISHTSTKYTSNPTTDTLDADKLKNILSLPEYAQNFESGDSGRFSIFGLVHLSVEVSLVVKEEFSLENMDFLRIFAFRFKGKL